MRLKDKTAIVTGASRGIGRAVVLKYAEEGAQVIAVARNEGNLRLLSEELDKNGLGCTTLAADVSSEVQCIKVVERALELNGKIDVLVNNAGMLGKRVEMTLLDLSDWKKVFEVNVEAVFVLSKLAATEMLKRSSGSIINITSGVVRRPYPKWGAYLPSKFAVEGMTMMLSEELRDTGVRVNLIDPGRTSTDMIRKAFPEVDPSTYKLPVEITDPFVFLASDESRLVTGTRIQIR
ncbi:MAG: SDR family oxidoreductase [Bacteroidetes bacterium]|nr:SDR family oxidoreductase [Bacteroidota bacterium]